MSVTVGDSAPHSALHSPEAPSGETRASGRAPAREDAQSTAQSTLKSAVTDSDQIGEMWDRFKDWITPPEIWTKGSAPLKQEWEYANRGAWTTQDGAIRRAGQIYALFFALPLTFALEYLQWTVKRFSRLAAALVLLYFLAQFPPVSWLI